MVYGSNALLRSTAAAATASLETMLFFNRPSFLAMRFSKSEFS